MQHMRIAAGIFLMASITQPAAAALSLGDNCTATVCTGQEPTTLTPISNWCTAHNTTCYNNTYQMLTCTQCSAGYTLKSYSVDIPCATLPYAYFDCVRACQSDSDCAAPRAWSCTGAYCSRTAEHCILPSTGGLLPINANTCDTQIEYACNTGYYGTTTNGISGCTSCPQSDSGLPGTSAIGAITNTQCYIASGTPFTDASGSGDYSGDSYYCN
ncbi:MAG: hypothetical protein K2L95_01120 [Alphaproteobacteria bacterium]|nr:hypothetical protein [Alphaproteobacteria bacterium]